MNQRTLLVLGAGGHGKAVAEAALLSGEWQRVCFVDDSWPALQACLHLPVLSNLQGLADVAADAAIAAVGNNALRQQWSTLIRVCGLELATVIHPRACVSPTAIVGAGSVIMAQAVVGVDVQLGEGVIVNAGALVDHDACLGPYAHLGVGVSLAGGVQVGAQAWLQAGCSAGYAVVVADAVVCGPGESLSANA
jgi:sugar O-acyltransferase (sialic acid O-acetyltransferase NeuD family)